MRSRAARGTPATLACVIRVLVLGSTGSIGVQALQVIAAAPDMACCGLACRTRVGEMEAQARSHGVAHTADGAAAPDHGDLMDASAPDIVLNAIVGAAGLPATLAALERGLPVALANKESLVVGGELVSAARARTGAPLVPVDSEHSAMFQLLEGVPRERVEAGVLTASGGPFRGRAAEELESVTAEQALDHPTWKMGGRITIDSATLMNKGFEVIEAHHLFGLPYERIEVVVHPQSLVHAMARLDDGSVLAHCGPPDMRVPIGYALRHPAPPPPAPPMELVGRRLEFEAPDEAAFPCLRLAREAGAAGGTAPAVLNGADEVAVAAFLEGRIGFMDIPRVVGAALEAVPPEPADDLAVVLGADARAREAAQAAIEGVPAWSA